MPLKPKNLNNPVLGYFLSAGDLYSKEIGRPLQIEDTTAISHFREALESHICRTTGICNRRGLFVEVMHDSGLCFVLARGHRNVPFNSKCTQELEALIQKTKEALGTTEDPKWYSEYKG